MVLQYKCPSCGADMVFDSQSGKLSCESCGHQDIIETTSENISFGEERNTSNTFDNFAEENNDNAFATQYECKNCGAALIVSADTTASTCSFCGAAMVLGDRLSGSLAPSKVIPFTISKEEAQKAFQKWCRKGVLMPKKFMEADRIKNITGIYIPFWLYDLNGCGEVNAVCTRIHTYERGDYIYTETKYYDVYRKFSLNYSKIPIDASEKMDDATMDKLEPFSYNDLKTFQTPYLAGFIAEKYNYNNNELFPRVKERTQTYIKDYVRSTIHGYATTTFRQENIQIRQKKTDYTLLPVWMICYDYKRTDHNFVMNGQTGKIIGKPPISLGKVAAWWFGISLGTFLILNLITILVGGSLL